MISILTGLKVQSDELRDLKQTFEQLDLDRNGTLSKEELEIGLREVCFFELL